MVSKAKGNGHNSNKSKSNDNDKKNKQDTKIFNTRQRTALISEFKLLNVNKSAVIGDNHTMTLRNRSLSKFGTSAPTNKAKNVKKIVKNKNENQKINDNKQFKRKKTNTELVEEDEKEVEEGERDNEQLEEGNVYDDENEELDNQSEKSVKENNKRESKRSKIMEANDKQLTKVKVKKGLNGIINELIGNNRLNDKESINETKLITLNATESIEPSNYTESATISQADDSSENSELRNFNENLENKEDSNSNTDFASTISGVTLNEYRPIIDTEAIEDKETQIDNNVIVLDDDDTNANIESNNSSEFNNDGVTSNDAKKLDFQTVVSSHIQSKNVEDDDEDVLLIENENEQEGSNVITSSFTQYYNNSRVRTSQLTPTTASHQTLRRTNYYQNYIASKRTEYKGTSQSTNMFNQNDNYNMSNRHSLPHIHQTAITSNNINNLPEYDHFDHQQHLISQQHPLRYQSNVYVNSNNRFHRNSTNSILQNNNFNNHNLASHYDNQAFLFNNDEINDKAAASYINRRLSQSTFISNNIDLDDNDEQ